MEELNTMYTSIDEIRKEFGFSENADIETMKKELTQEQKKIHPDVNENYTQEDNKRFSRIAEAKDFLKKYDSTLVPVSVITDLLKVAKKDNEISKIEKLETNIAISVQKKYLEIKHRFLPRKITLGAIMAVVTFLWSFPSALKEHPYFGEFFLEASRASYSGAFIILTALWLMLMIISIGLLWLTFMRESRLKRILYNFENLSNQYEIFSCFINEINNNEFTQQDLDNYIVENLSQSNKNKKAYKYSIDVLINNVINRVILVSKSHIENIVPQISEMLICRALEKGIIQKADKVSWYDTYIIIEQ